MTDFACTNCGRPTEENEHHVRLSYGDAVEPGGCVRILLDVYRQGAEYTSRSRVLGISPQRQAAKIVPLGAITM